jgi:DNA replication protein DnaC
LTSICTFGVQDIQPLVATRFLDRLICLELEGQEERRVTQAIRTSHLPTGPTLSNFDFAYQPSVSRTQIEMLSTCQWIRECHGLLLQGPPGVGKTHLSVAPGLRAIENSFSVSFYRVDELIYQLKQDVDVSPSRLKYKKYMASDLLILDEFGYEPLDGDHDQQRHHELAGGVGWRRSARGSVTRPPAALGDGVKHPGPQIPLT